MNTDDLLSIGEFSKLTGVGINSLRYYDRIGILKPVYVNPGSQYRYYSFMQIELVYAIQLCVAYGVQLKDFTTMVTGSQTILYSELLKRAEAAIIQEQMILQDALLQVQSYQCTIQHAESCLSHSEPRKYHLRGHTCLITPYTGIQPSNQVYKILKEKLGRIYRNGCKLGNEYGLLLLREQDIWTQYLFIDVAIPDGVQFPGEKILCLPEGCYLCQKQDHSQIERFKSWIPVYVEEDDIECVIESMFLLGEYPYENPPLELRCLLRQGSSLSTG